MTMHGFQSALAYIIRNAKPKDSESLAAAFVRYDLSDEEKTTLTNLSSNQRLIAYGDDMLSARWRITRRAINFLFRYIDGDRLKQLFLEDFDAKHDMVAFPDVSIAFLSYLLTDAVGQRLVKESNVEFVPDLIKYVRCVFAFSKNTRPPEHMLKPKSSLVHGFFTIIDLDHDVRELFSDFLDTEDSKAYDPSLISYESDATENNMMDAAVMAPEKRALTLLFIEGEQPTDFRAFDIDKEVKSFLLDQLNDTPLSDTVPLPECYDGLVELGLCKPKTFEEKLAIKVRSEIDARGFFHYTESISEEQFRRVASNMGTIVGEDPIKLYVTKRKLHSPAEIEFHTDSILSDINCWWCEEAAARGGATAIIDTADIVNYFSESEISMMTEIMMDCPNRSHTEWYVKPFLTKDGNRNRIFYTPWFMHKPDDPRLSIVQDKIMSYVHMKAADAKEITLKKGECLFIDNKRMLHGRGALSPDTKRSLVRLWLATGKFDERLKD